MRARHLAGLVLLATAAACGDDTTTSGAGSGGGGTGAGGVGGEGDGGTASSSSSSGAGAEGPGAGGAAPGSGGSGGAMAGSGGSGGAGGEAPLVDPCETRDAVCSDTAPSASGQGLVPLDRCGFALDRGASFDDLPPLIDALESQATPVTLAAVLGDLNRAMVNVSPGSVPGGPPGVVYAFRWDDEENDKPTWVPQGITSSSDASATGVVLGRKLLVVSSYFKEDEAPGVAPKGVRLAFVDVTDPTAPRYRMVLLVEPTADGNIEPVRIHAGGIAWVGDLLYVADTSAGLRVFDTRRLLQVDTSADVIGCDGTVCRGGLYKYVLPQVGAYRRATTCDEAPRFSFVALDRSAAVPRLVTGEYCSGTACSGPLAGRVFRWEVDPATGLLAGGERTWSTDAFFMGERQVQGAVSSGDTFYLSSSEPPGTGGVMYRVTGAGRTTSAWIDTPEDVVIDTNEQRIISLSEGLGERYVMVANLAAYQP